MSYYPLITGNSSATLFDRLKDGVQGVVGSQNTSILTKKLVAANGYEFIYTVLIIENNGTVGSSLSIDSLFIEDASGVATLSTDGLNAATQESLFCLSPLKKTNVNTWTADYPFMGLVDSSYAVTKEHTKNLTAGNSNQNYVDAATGANTFLKIGVDTSGTLIWLDNGGNDDNGANQTVKGYIPLYTAAQLVANDIPAGSYGAVLIKCDITTGMIATQIDYKLKLNHDGNNGAGNEDFNITLRVTGENVFVFGFHYNGVDIVSGVSESTLYSVMSPMAEDYWSGTSWQTSFIDGQIHGITTASTSSSSPSIGAFGSETPQTVIQDVLTTVFNSVTDYTPYLQDNYNLAVKAFDGNAFRLFDGSSIPESFLVTSSETTGTLLSQAANLQLGANLEVKADGVDGIRNIKHSSTSDVLSSGTHTLDAKGVYQNFAKEDITATSTSTHVTAKGGTKTLVIPYCVYPLFTYSAATIAKVDTNVNLVTDTDGTTNLYERDTDTYATISPSGLLTPISYSYPYSLLTGGTTTISNHNVRINTLSGIPPINEQFVGYAEHSTNVARVTGTEDAFTTDGSVVTVSASNIDGDTHDYTIVSTKDVPKSTLATGTSGAFNVRSGGSYLNSMSINGVHSTANNFKAPVTNWKKTALGGSSPYYETVGASYKTLRLNDAHYDSRPLINIGHSGASTALITDMEFLAPAGYTSTGNSLVNGIFDYGTNEFREVSYALRSVISTNVLHAVVGNDSNLSRLSYVAGMEIFGLDTAGAFAAGRHFIGSITAFAANTEGNTLKLNVVDAGGTAVNATASIPSFTVTIGKKLYAASSRNTTFVHTESATLGFYKERDRVNSAYGNDLSYRIDDIKESEVKIGDKLHLESHAAAGDAVVTALGFTSPSINEAAIASASGTVDVAGTVMSMYNFTPQEVGIEYSGSTLLSERFSDNKKKSVYRESSSAYYMADTPVFANGLFTTSLSLFLFNEGLEDVYIKSVELFDPYYLPKGEFLVNPAGATPATWSVVCTAINSDSSPNTYTGVDLNSSSLSPVDQNSLIKLPRKAVDTNTNDNEVSSNTIDISFSAPTGAAGHYFKAVEISYYRDISATQKYKVEGVDTFRTLKERPIWVTRKLIKVEISSSSDIDVFDADDTAVTTIINFGTITA